ncbi:bifunctional glutamate N-acetyltransferase/amino-acid acetyltransferase ArgJ [Desulfovibrio sp. OttesenSCG-928-G11]|nr:bifunctional glutamate N-acetyltransferase/amino-acid acetyltransferase ArgJ [Desulfovibrio sp. OttesenSCG-928-G11]
MTHGIPKGFRLAVAEAGFKYSGRNDAALVVSELPACAAGLFTSNLFQAAPVMLGKARLKRGGPVRAVLFNAGQANACTGEEGLEDCRQSLQLVAAACGLEAGDILPASTGVIGMRMPMSAWENAAPLLADSLGRASLEDFAKAMMTTDAFPKYVCETLLLSGGEVTLAGAAKGAGMICPNMATMLSLVLCDAVMEPGLWQSMFVRATARSFNRVTVDGDTSTNDTLYGLANGASGVEVKGKDLAMLEEVLTRLLGQLAYMLVKDGEGATKVLHIHVTGARDAGDAEMAARAVGHSPLVKTAAYGMDANWGRIVAALGRSGARFAPDEVRICLCGVELFRGGIPTELDFDALLKNDLRKRDMRLDISLGAGPGAYRLLASDLGHKYVTINADYRS